MTTRIAYESSDTGSATRPIRLALAEDSLLLREGLIRLFDEAGLVTVGAYGDADSLLRDFASVDVDLVILDVRMPPTFTDEGVRAALEIRRRSPTTGILLLSQYVEEVYAVELLTAGQSGVGYLLKDRLSSLDELKSAVGRIAAGGTVLDEQVVRHLLNRRLNPLGQLTARERDVIALMAEGRTNAAIAGTLTIGTGAVEKHVTSIFGKLGLDGSGSDHRRVLAVLAWLQLSA